MLPELAGAERRGPQGSPGCSRSVREVLGRTTAHCQLLPHVPPSPARTGTCQLARTLSMHRGHASPRWDANSPQHPKVLLFQQKVVVKQPTREPPAARCSPEAGIHISPSTSPGSAGPHPAQCCRRRCQRGECQPGGFLQTPASSGRLIINCVSCSNCCSRQRSWTRHQKQLASPPRRYAAACSAPCSRPPRAAKGGRRNPASSTGRPLLQPQHQSWAGAAPGPWLQQP